MTGSVLTERMVDQKQADSSETSVGLLWSRRNQNLQLMQCRLCSQTITELYARLIPPTYLSQPGTALPLALMSADARFESHRAPNFDIARYVVTRNGPSRSV